MNEEPVIFFIEDEPDHFEAVREHLEPEYCCVCFGAADLGKIGIKAESYKPTAAVVDWMLYSSTDDADRAANSLKALSDQYEKDHFRKNDAGAGGSEDQGPKEGPRSGVEAIFVFKKVLPSMRIFMYTQEAGEHNSVLKDLVDASFAKKLDTQRRLINGKEIADGVRKGLRS